MTTMKISTSAIAATSALLIAGSLVSCSNGATAGNAGAGSTQTVQIGVFPITGNLPAYVAQDKGIFEKNGLSVQLVGPATAGTTAFQLMTTNKMQAYFSTVLNFQQGVSNGTNVEMAACLPPKSIFVLVGDKNLLETNGSFEQKAKALAGKTIGVTALGAGTDIALSAVLTTSGLAPNSVTHLAVGNASAAIGQLEAKRIDGYSIGSASGAFQIADKVPGAGIYLDLGADGSPSKVSRSGAGTWAVSSQWAKESPAQVDKFRTALKEANAWIVEHPDEAAQIMSKEMFGGDQLEVAKKSVAFEIENFLKDSGDLKCDQSAYDESKQLFEDQKLGDASKLKFDDVVYPGAR